jgi:hypothetical protein
MIGTLNQEELAMTTTKNFSRMILRSADGDVLLADWSERTPTQICDLLLSAGRVMIGKSARPNYTDETVTDIVGGAVRSVIFFEHESR